MVKNVSYDYPDGEVKTKPNRCIQGSKKCLKFFSLGQYNTVLFHKNTSV